MINKIKDYLLDEIESSNEVIEEYTSDKFGSRPKCDDGSDDFIEGHRDLAQRLLLQIGVWEEKTDNEEDLKLLDDVIYSLYDDYERASQEYPQEVTLAWGRIRDKLGRSKRGEQEEWAWVYGDECDFLWDHFGMEVRSSNDRMKIKLVEFEASQEEEAG